MKLTLVGLNHRTAPVDVRERIAFGDATLPDAISQLKGSGGIVDSLILSTCNRVEVAVTATEEVNASGEIVRFLAQQGGVDRSALEPHLYHFEDRDAVRHLFRVAASLDSMIVGEPQILGQLKAAYALAKAHGALNGALDAIITRAFAVAKRVRTETEIGSSAVSVSYAAVELARDIFGALKGRTVMLIGAGKMSELAARHLRRSGAAVQVTNRTASRAAELASMVEGTVVSYDSFRAHLKDADIIIASSGAPEYLLRKDDVKRVIDARRNRPMFLIDIAVPRNLDPAINDLANVFLYDIDDLQRVVTENMKGRLSAAEEADRIVAEEVERLEASMRARSVVPVIVDLQESLERLRAAEVERLRGKLGDLTPQQEQAIEQLTRGIVNKIAHGPIAALRRNADDPSIVDRIRNVFRLDEENEPARMRGK